MMTHRSRSSALGSKAIGLALFASLTFGSALSLADETTTKKATTTTTTTTDNNNNNTDKQQQKKKAQRAKDKNKDKDVTKDTSATQPADTTTGNADTTNGEQYDNSSEPSRNRTTDSRKQTPPKTTEVAGQKAVNKDEDLDVAVGKTETTSVQNTPNRPDVIESRAEARREGEGRRVTVAPLVGYGFNDLGVGVGARAGYTFDFPVYLGGTFMYHNGRDGVRDNVVDSSGRFMYPAIEVGYDIGIGPVLLRPYAGGGLLIGRIRTVNAAGIESTDTESALMIYPGVNAHYIIGKSPVFVGADTRVLLPFENQGPSLTLLGTAGLHL